jgi:hypothetical protein
MDCEPAEPRSAVCRGAWRTPERPGWRSGAETPESAGFRSASRFGLPRRKPCFPGASKTGSSRPSKAPADSRWRSKVGGEWPRGPPGHPTMKDRRQCVGRFRSGVADSKPAAKVSRFPKREAPRYKNLPEPPRFGFISRPNPGIECSGLTFKLTGPAPQEPMKPLKPAAGSG